MFVGNKVGIASVPLSLGGQYGSNAHFAAFAPAGAAGFSGVAAGLPGPPPPIFVQNEALDTSLQFTPPLTTSRSGKDFIVNKIKFYDGLCVSTLVCFVLYCIYVSNVKE